MVAPKGVVLLAAGSGSRLSPLTDVCHKSLLNIAGHPSLKWIIDQALDAGVEDVVIVTGHRHEDVEFFVHKNYGNRVRCVFNHLYREDVNILSVDLGVSQLRDASAGYMIVETDVVIDPRGWGKILDVDNRSSSYWVTRGKYTSKLTGGVLIADADGRVTDLVYRPQYDPAYEGGLKLLGILYVGSEQVLVDRSTRLAAMGKTISQYYMMPWVENLARLPCLVRDLGDFFGASFNDVPAYRSADKEYKRIIKTQVVSK